jgi:hypothetical protein
MDPKIIEEVTKALTERLREAERASVLLEVGSVKVKGIGIQTRFLTPNEVWALNGLGSHPDPFYAHWAEMLSMLTAKHICGPAESGVNLVKDKAPLCQFDDIPSTGCLYRCGPILSLNTDIGQITAPPCHGAGKPACAGVTMFDGLCTMIKAAGCKPADQFAQWYAYAVSMLDFSNRVYRIHEVELKVDDKPLALYSFGMDPEQKLYDELLYFYMVIAFPFDLTGVSPPPGSE